MNLIMPIEAALNVAFVSENAFQNELNPYSLKLTYHQVTVACYRVTVHMRALSLHDTVFILTCRPQVV